MAEREVYLETMGSLSTVTSEGGFVVVEIANGVKHHLHQAEEGLVRLTDVESGSFNIFVDWLYTQNVSVYGRNGKADDDIHDIAELNAIVLGDRLLTPAFTKAVQKHFVVTYTQNRKVPPFTVVTCAYGRSKDDNPILEMLVDLHVTVRVENALSKGTVEECKMENELPHKFLLRIMHKNAQNNQVSKRNCLYASDYGVM